MYVFSNMKESKKAVACPLFLCFFSKRYPDPLLLFKKVSREEKEGHQVAYMSGSK